MRLSVCRRPRAGTLLGLLALAIAGFGGVSALRASSSAAPVAAPATARYLSESVDVAGGDYETLPLDCASTDRVISGGFWVSRANDFAAQNYPYLPGGVGKGWTITASNVPPLVDSDFEAEIQALCAKAGAPLILPR